MVVEFVCLYVDNYIHLFSDFIISAHREGVCSEFITIISTHAFYPHWHYNNAFRLQTQAERLRDLLRGTHYST